MTAKANISALTLAAFFLLTCAILTPASSFCASPEQKNIFRQPLVAWFSVPDTTGLLAKEIHRQAGGDIICIDSGSPATKSGNKAKWNGAKLPNIDKYDIIFLGFPMSSGQLPIPVVEFIYENGLDGKTIATFDGNGADSRSRGLAKLKKLVPHARLLQPLPLSTSMDGRHEHSGTFVKDAEKDITKWLEGLGPALIETTTGNPAIYPDGGY